MPFRNQQRARDYKRKYMKKYREFKRHQLEQAMRALEQGNASRAKRILQRKPNISIRATQRRRTTRRRRRR